VAWGGIRRATAVGVLACSVLTLFPPTARAQQFGIESFTGMVFADEARDDSDAYTNTGGDEGDAYPVPGTGTGIYELAGGHPYIGVTDFAFDRTPAGAPAGGNVGTLRVDIPRGLMPNPRAFARCTDAQLEALACPLESQIGTEELTLYIEALAALGDIALEVPLYNMTPLNNPEDDGPRRDVVARFAFHPAEAVEAISPLPTLPPLPPPLDGLLPGALTGLAAGLAGLHSVHIVGGVRDEPSAFGPFDYGLLFTIDHLPAYDDADPASPGVVRTNLTFWGVPGDPAHDAAAPGERGRGVSCVGFEQTTPLIGEFCTPIPAPGSAPDPATPFLSNPTECTGEPLEGKLTVYSHPDAGPVVVDTETDTTPTIVDVDDGQPKDGAQECQQLPFGGGLELLPGVTAPDSPVGPLTRLTVPQLGLADRDVFATAHVKDVSVTLPAGMTLNPSAANGLEACTDAQLAANAGVPGGEACPDASRVGTVSAVSPLLPPAADEPGSIPVIAGSAYVGQPLPGDMYRLFVTLDARDVAIRSKGTVEPDPGTGQITATFPNNPQLPFDELSVDLRDGPRAPLATPLECGSKEASATLAPWSGTTPIAVSGDPFPIGGAGCPPGFGPSFGVASAQPLAGALAAFTASFGRPDRNQYLDSVRVKTPPGLAGMVSRVEECASAAAAAGACPAASRIGTAHTTAGAGSDPYPLSGPVYLTEGYKGAPFGMVAAIRAIAGPYDLGTVVVRQAVFVDPEDAHLTVISDPLPRILEGVPVRLRTIDVRLDRPGFVYNPTSCGAKQVTGTLHSTRGATVERSAAIDFAACERLRFRPRMTMRLFAPRQTGFGEHPGLRVRVTQPRGQANIRSARVTLPLSLALDPDNATAICGYEAGLAARCPARSRIGRAKAISPALDDPLVGPVYLVQGVRFDEHTGNRIRTLPTLLATVRGQVRLNLRGTTDVERRRLVSSFEAVPDAPVSRFDLRLRGARGGILAISARRGICHGRQVSRAELGGQNGKAATQRVRMRRPCRSPGLRVRRLRLRAGGLRLVVRGTVARQARKRLRVVVRCGGKGIRERTRRPRRGRWSVALKVGRCAGARRAELRVRYPGGGDFRPAARGRRVSLRVGS
jgi:hypothetical protein